MSRQIIKKRIKTSHHPCAKCKGLPSVYNELKRNIESRDVRSVFHILRCSYDLKVNKQDDVQTLSHITFHEANCRLDLQQDIIQILKLLFNRGVNVNAKNDKGLTVLHLAIDNRMTKVINFLLDNKADLHIRDDNENSLLHFLIETEHRKILNLTNPSINFPSERILSTNFISWMVMKDLDVDCQNKFGETSLHLAAKYNLLHALAVLLKHVKDVKICNNDKKTAFEIFVEPKNNIDKTIYARLNNKYGLIVDTSPSWFLSKEVYEAAFIDKIFNTFLSRGFEPNFVDNQGRTPLHYALIMNRPTIAELLLKKFTKVKACGNDGNTVLHLVMNYLCKEKGHLPQQRYKQIARALWFKGANIHVTNKRGLSPLTIAMKNKDTSILKLIFEYEAKMYNRHYTDSLLLHFLKLKIEETINHKKIFDFLMKGREINAKDKQGMTLLHVAALMDNNQENIVELLVTRGAHVDVIDNNGHLPLHKAIIHRKYQALRTLILFGADINDNMHLLDIDDIKSSTSESNVHQTNLYNTIIQSPSFQHVLTEHLVKLQAAQLTIDNKLIKLLRFDDIFAQTVYQNCISEVNNLKQYEITENLSLYDLLKVNRKSVRAYQGNENLDKLFSSYASFQTQFPMYYSLIISSYCRALHRQKLVEPAKEALFKFSKNRLPELCTHEIVSYLENASLRSMIEAAEKL